MKIAIVGTGSIGSTFALHLARAGHDVTVVARGQRLAQLERDGAIVTTAGARAPVTVHPALETTTAWDLVLVTVLASQLEPVLPALQASAARCVMFMFNTFEPLDRLRDAVGPKRFAFGFPAVLATLKEGRLASEVYKHGQITTVTDRAWAEVFARAGIPTAVTDDMESWLRTHAPFIVPLMSVAVTVHARGAGVSWDEARRATQGIREGFAIVRELGNRLTPSAMARLSRVPDPVLSFVIWSLSRLRMVSELGAQGPSEPRTLIDAMCAAAPGHSATLRSLRP